MKRWKNGENSPFSTNASLGASTTPPLAQHAKQLADNMPLKVMHAPVCTYISYCREYIS